MLLPPAVGVADNAIVGAMVAEPLTPESALFSNPAGLVGFRKQTYSAGLGLLFAELDVHSAAAGYDKGHDFIGQIPSFAVVHTRATRWRLAFGMHGSVGSSFDFNPEPPQVPSTFVSEVSIVSLPLAIAYEASERLWLGAELVPLLGYQRNRFPLPDPTSGTVSNIRYTLRGPGMQAMLGATWRPMRDWSLGLGVRTPGVIWMDGSTPVGTERRDVDLTLTVPTQISVGVQHRRGRFDLAATVRWTDATMLGDSSIKFAGTALPFVPAAHDEWKFGVGGVFRWTETLSLLAGAAYASRIVGNAGVSPLLYDGEDVNVGGGIVWRRGAWTFEGMGGQEFADHRDVAPGEALILPGRYRAEGTIAMFGVMFER